MGFIPTSYEIEREAADQHAYEVRAMCRDHYAQMTRDAIANGDEEGSAQWSASAATYGRELLILLGRWNALEYLRDRWG
jgi:hypothetical protein